MQSIQEFISKQLELLKVERDAEIQQRSQENSASGNKRMALEKKGLALNKLVISSQRTGLYGRRILCLSANFHKELPAHTITSGDIVGLLQQNDENQESTGVVTSVTPSSISISIDQETSKDDYDQEPFYSIVKLANDVTYKRLKDALSDLSESKVNVLKNILFGIGEIGSPNIHFSPKIVDENGELSFINPNLDESQQEAVKFALLQKEIGIIHGPPGTGKTTTIVEIITQAVKSGSKVLCCAPSNIAVDNLVERLAKNKVKIVRLGHPARINQELQKYSLDAYIDSSEQTQLVRDVRSDIDKSLRDLKRCTNAGQRAKIKNELKSLRKECREREEKAMKEILSKADVILSTLTSASSNSGPLRSLSDGHFDITVIDECSQALEMACWIVLPQAPKTILAGDHLQLPPTIMSLEAAEKGLSMTLMERLISWNPKIVRLLSIQYRMNEKIMKWSSDEFYESKLRAHESVASRLLNQIPGIVDNDISRVPLMMIDTAGCDMFELVTEDEISKANEGEVAIVCAHVRRLIHSGLSPEEIAVITPYNLQVEFIRLQLGEEYPSLEIRSVDGFQGREKEAVVLSLVRSNPNGDVGFLAESRRLNVAVTRAKRHVAVICDTETVGKTDPFLKRFTEYMETHGEVLSAQMYNIQEGVVRPEGLEVKINDSNRSRSEKTKKTINKPKKKSKNMEKSNFVEKNRITTAENSTNSETRNDDRTNGFRVLIRDFIRKPDTIYEFDPSLNSHERMLIHRLVESEFPEISHESVGEDKRRRIVLKKDSVTTTTSTNTTTTTTTEKTQSLRPSKSSVAEIRENVGGTRNKFENLTIESAKPSRIDTATCTTCSKSVPKENLDLHRLRCENPVKKETTKKKKASKTKMDKNREDDDDDDFDAICESFAKLDRICNYDVCKTKISTLGVICEFCRVKFCLSHSMPEIHGCGTEAKISARLQISRDGKLYPGSGKPDNRPDKQKRAQLERKLEKKLNDKMQERKPKKKVS